MAPENENLKRYLDAGVAFTQMTREKAEEIVQELVKRGEVRRKEAEKNIEELLERSRHNTEELLGVIRREVAEQLKNLGLDDLAKRAGGGASADKPPTPSAPTAASTGEPVKKAAKAAKKATKKVAKSAKKASS